MGSCCGFPAPLPACTSSSTDVSLSLVRLGMGRITDGSIHEKNLHLLVAPPPPCSLRNPGCGTDHWAGVTMQCFRSSAGSFFIETTTRGRRGIFQDEAVGGRTVNSQCFQCGLPSFASQKLCCEPFHRFFSRHSTSPFSALFLLSVPRVILDTVETPVSLSRLLPSLRG